MPGNQEDDFLRNNAFSLYHYITYMATPLHKNPCPGGNDIYNFGRPLLYTLFVWTMSRSSEEDFKRYNAFSLYELYGRTLVQATLPGGHEIFQFFIYT